MIQNSFGRLERCWKTSPLIPQLKITACRFHTHQDQHKNIGGQPPYHHRKSSLRTLQCRHASHIVKSPFKDIVIPNKLIQEMVWDTVDRFPESTAIKCGLTDRAYTFAEIQKLSYRFANSLRKAGFTKGDVISIMLPNCPEFAIIALGALEAELAISLINHSYTDAEILHQLNDSRSVGVVAAPENLTTVLSAISKYEEKTQSKPVRKIIAMDIPCHGSLPSGVVRFSEMVANSVDSSMKSASAVQPDELSFLPYSSGTTGLSKGVSLSHRNLVANILQVLSVAGWKINSPAEGQDITLGLLPFYHIFGLSMILLASLAQGGQILTLPKFEKRTFFNTLVKEKISVMKLVPPLVLFLGNSDEVLPRHLASLRLMVCGAAPIGVSDLERFKAKLHPGNNSAIVQVYGMTELSPAATVVAVPPKTMATVGVPVANTFAKVINPVTGESLGPHESGELCIKGPQTMLGYLNNPKATSEILDSEGWLRTGDNVYYDLDNHFYVIDRLKELIKVKGFQVPPAELEEVLRSNPFISDVGVIGVPCERNGETPVAYIVQKENKKLTVDDIKRFLSEKVSRHKQVSEVFFCESIPKSLSGKILRRELMAIYKNHHKFL